MGQLTTHVIDTAHGTPGAGTAPADAGGMPPGAISPAVVAEAAIEAVEADRVHAIVGPHTDVVVRQRVDGLLAERVGSRL